MIHKLTKVGVTRCDSRIFFGVERPLGCGVYFWCGNGCLGKTTERIVGETRRR